MRDFLKLSGRWLRAGWFWAFVLLALPNCGLDTSGIPCPPEGCPTDCTPGDPECDPPCDDPDDPECPPPDPVEAFKPGLSPTSAIMCDFPKPVPDDEDDCATQQEADDGMSITKAAVALVEGQSNAIALDFSEDALLACNGRPRKTKFLQGSFPDGATVCLNCGTQIPMVFASPTKACIAKCKDLINFGGGPIPAGGTNAFCEANAKISTNYTSCADYANACTGGGNPDPNFFDPRRHQEKVVWSDLSLGVEAFGTGNNSLRRTAPTTGPAESDFNEGAASAQTIVEGDGWVEFEAGQPGLSHVIGLRESCADPGSCADTNYGLGGIGFSISLNNDNNVYVIEAGNPLVVEGPFGLPYTPGERFRVRATDNNNGTATITYSRVAPGCMEGTVCLEDVFWTSESPSPDYPLRVDTTFREVDASLVNVTIVRIKTQ
jgi:hypothetical protein